MYPNGPLRAMINLASSTLCITDGHAAVMSQTLCTVPLLGWFKPNHWLKRYLLPPPPNLTAVSAHTRGLLHGEISIIQTDNRATNDN